MSFLDVVKGCTVVLAGLHEQQLNGQKGVVLGRCNDTGRWAVQVGARRLAVKDGNLAVVTKSLEGVCRNKMKLCRYGSNCWRPGCHFTHPCERDRAKQMAFFLVILG